MSEYKLIAFDMDGTLLDSHKNTTPRTEAMIHKAIASGKVVALCTGRSVPEIRAFTQAHKDIRYAICASGGLVYDCAENKTLSSHVIGADLIKEMLKVSVLEDSMPVLMGEFLISEKKKLSDMARYNMGQYQSLYVKEAIGVDNILDYYKENPLGHPKVNFYNTSIEARDRFRQRLKHLDLEIVDSEYSSLEFTPRGITKGLGLKILCDKLRISTEEAIAVGDADNDIPALTTAGLGIAMANANENVKAACDFIVADNDHDGCAEAIEKYLLG